MIRILCADISRLDPRAQRLLYEQAVPDRKARADRYRRQEDSLRCLAAGALLRLALGGRDCPVAKGPDGKPWIPDRPDFHYNLSHAGRWAVIAFGSSPVGVDVEHIRADTDIRAIASRFFTEEEQQYILESPALSRGRFFEVWTDKESYLKFLGTGLKRDLKSFSVFSPEPGIRFFRTCLPGDYRLSLCTTDPRHSLEILEDPGSLLTK